MPPPLHLAFVMNPIESVDIDADTSFALMLEAQERGHRIYTADQADLGVARGTVTARVCEVTLRRERGRHVQRGEPRILELDETMDAVFQRTDPPVDDAYIRATQLLTLCRRATVLNRPDAILSSNEKLYTLQFPELMTDTLVTRDLAELRAFLERVGGSMVVKPLEGRGGEGIFLARRGDPNLASILEQATGFGSHWTLAQRFLPDVEKGDKRILLLEGELLGAVNRIPARDEVRANFHSGGSAAPAEIDDADRRIVERLAPRLREDGFFLVGIDVIAGHLTEINVTSPTGIQEASRLSGRNLSAPVIDALERRLRG